MVVKKIIPGIKVSDMPFFSGTISKEDKLRYGITTSTGIDNAYRLAFVHGEGASTKDETWNRAKHIHDCCGSKVAWRHKAKCEKALKNAPDDYSDLKDPINLEELEEIKGL